MTMLRTKTGTLMLLAALAVVRAGPLLRPKRQILDLDDPAASNFTANEVCFYDNEIYQRGDTMPNPGPCEECKCEPPSIVCNMIKCPVNSGCRTIQKPNHCCPDYKCECEHNGDIYSNGERLDTPDEPCQVCYCKGGEVMCTSITCYHRDDCEPQYVPGQCCPKFDHCPLRDMPSASENNDNAILRNKTYVNSAKREMQPWLLTKSVNMNTKPLTTQRSIEDFITDKPNEQETRTIISDWLEERRSTTESDESISDRSEPTTTLVPSTFKLDSNIIGKDNQDLSTTDNEESSTFFYNIETTTVFYDNNNKDKQFETEQSQNQSQYPSTDNTVTTNAPEIVESNNNSLENSDETSVSNMSENDPESTKATVDDVYISETPTEVNGEEKLQERKTEVDMIMSTTIEYDLVEKHDKNKVDDVNPTESFVGHTSSNDISSYEITQQNGLSAHDRRTEITYEGSGQVPLDENNDTESLLPEEMSGDFENIETTKFSEHDITFTTPFVEDFQDMENKKESTDTENEIKENVSISKVLENSNSFESQTEGFSTSNVTLSPNSEMITDTKQDRSEQKQENLSTTLFEDNLMIKVGDNQSDSEEMDILENENSDEIPVTIKDNSFESETDITDKDDSNTKVEDNQAAQVDSLAKTASHKNNSLKSILTQEDAIESELEEDSVEEKNKKETKNSEEFHTKVSNEEEGENNEEPPVLELNNQLPFLQLGGHGSSELSSTSESYIFEVDSTENNKNPLKYDVKNLTVKTIPSEVIITQPNTSTHITLTPGDLKILAEYIINEKIKPIGRPSNNETSHYMPTEWLKGNLTSDVKISSILTAANISIGIMNTTNTESKIKTLDDVEHLLNVGKNVESKDTIGQPDVVGENNKNVENTEELYSDKNIPSSTISTKLSLVTDTSISGTENVEPDDDNKQSLPVKEEQETQTEKINFETDIFEGTTTKYSELSSNTTPKDTTDNTNTDQAMTTEITLENQTMKISSETTVEVKDLKEKNIDISASRKVRIPEMESIVKEPFSVNLEDNDLTIVRDFLQKHMVFP